MPGGHPLVGESLDVPDLFPYDCYRAVTVLSDTDSVPLDSFTEVLLADDFGADLAHLDVAGTRGTRTSSTTAWTGTTCRSLGARWCTPVTSQ